MKDHCNRTAMAKAWKNVSEVAHISVEHCKSTWKSLRDSFRYHTSKKKSGSACDLEDDEGILQYDWEYVDDMSFLTPSSLKRRTISQSTSKSSEDPEFENAGTSNYSYLQDMPPEKKSKKTTLEESALTVSDSMVEFVKMKKAECEKYQFNHHIILANLDRMLSKLSEDVVEDLNMTFLALTYEKLKQNKNQPLAPT